MKKSLKGIIWLNLLTAIVAIATFITGIIIGYNWAWAWLITAIFSIASFILNWATINRKEM